MDEVRAALKAAQDCVEEVRIGLFLTGKALNDLEELLQEATEKMEQRGKFSVVKS